MNRIDKRYIGDADDYVVNETISLAPNTLLASGSADDLIKEFQNPGLRELQEGWNDASYANIPYPDDGLTEDERLAITTYTGEYSYYRFNTETKVLYSQVASGMPCDFPIPYHWKGMYHLLTSGIRKLRQHSGPLTVYRGQRSQPIVDTSDAIKFRCFTSTSVDEEVAKEFGRFNVMFKIQTNQGAEITNYSIFKNENEVLIPPTETFIVKRKEQIDGTLWYDLRSVECR